MSFLYIDREIQENIDPEIRASLETHRRSAPSHFPIMSHYFNMTLKDVKKEVTLIVEAYASFIQAAEIRHFTLQTISPMYNIAKNGLYPDIPPMNEIGEIIYPRPQQHHVQKRLAALLQKYTRMRDLRQLEPRQRCQQHLQVIIGMLHEQCSPSQRPAGSSSSQQQRQDTARFVDSPSRYEEPGPSHASFSNPLVIITDDEYSSSEDDNVDENADQRNEVQAVEAVQDSVDPILPVPWNINSDNQDVTEVGHEEEHEEAGDNDSLDSSSVSSRFSPPHYSGDEIRGRREEEKEEYEPSNSGTEDNVDSSRPEIVIPRRQSLGESPQIDSDDDDEGSLPDLAHLPSPIPSLQQHQHFPAGLIEPLSPSVQSVSDEENNLIHKIIQEIAADGPSSQCFTYFLQILDTHDQDDTNVETSNDNEENNGDETDDHCENEGESNAGVGDGVSTSLPRHGLLSPQPLSSDSGPPTIIVDISDGSSVTDEECKQRARDMEARGSRHKTKCLDNSIIRQVNILQSMTRHRLFLARRELTAMQDLLQQQNNAVVELEKLLPWRDAIQTTPEANEDWIKNRDICRARLFTAKAAAANLSEELQRMQLKVKILEEDQVQQMKYQQIEAFWLK